MSLFSDDAVLLDECPRTTVAEGVRLERRSLLRLSAATVAAGLATACSTPTRKASAEGSAPAASLEAPRTDGTLDLAGFLDEMYPRAKRFVASGGQGEEAYLMAVGELMARLETTSPEATGETMKAFVEGQEDFSRELWVVMFDLEPGKGFTHHDHRSYNGVILGCEGEAHVRNYDILGDDLVPPKGETFQIRQVRDDVILPGRFSSLGTTRENVHDLVAGPEGAVVLDVFTFLPNAQGSHFMDVAETPRDAERKIYDASWA